MNIFECIFSNDLQHLSLDVHEVGDHPIVHSGVTSENKGMVVDLYDRRGSGSSDVTKERSGRRVGTNAAEVVVIAWWFSMLVLVHSWSDSLGFAEIFSGLVYTKQYQTRQRC